MTITVSAYCVLCQKNVVGKLNEIVALDSGKMLYIGECPDCYYQIKRIMNNIARN
jgi:hypothetical protein